MKFEDLKDYLQYGLIIGGKINFNNFMELDLGDYAVAVYTNTKEKKAILEMKMYEYSFGSWINDNEFLEDISNILKGNYCNLTANDGCGMSLESYLECLKKDNKNTRKYIIFNFDDVIFD